MAAGRQQARDDVRAIKEAREKARPILEKWIKDVEAKVRAKQLIDFDRRLAEILINYPSANLGYGWAGQTHLAEQAGRCVRTIGSSLRRMVAAGLLLTQRGGPGRTSRWTLCRDGRPIFGSIDRQGLSDQDRQRVAGLDRQGVADKPSEEDPYKREPPPLSSPNAEVVDFETERMRRCTNPPPELIADDKVEILNPSGDMTFNEFWAASGCVGKSGPAFAAWQKLTREDRRAIGDFAARNGGKIDTDGLWAGNWLQGRRWEAPRLQRPKSRAEEIEEAVARAAALMEKEWQPVRSERWVHGDDPEWPEVCRAYGHAPTLKDNRGGWTFVTK